MASVLAFDFGASSGRAVLAEWKDDFFRYWEIHRFENNPITKNGRLCWDFPLLMKEVRAALERAGPIDSVGFDTWGVDFGVLDQDGKLLALPIHYRDSRAEASKDKILRRIPAEDLYACTGNQIMPINTLFQLAVLQAEQPALMQKAETLLFMPDLFAYQLCGNAVCERSIASTSQMLNPTTKAWAVQIADQLGIQSKIFPPLVDSGTVIGAYSDADGYETKVVAVAGHDTQCAIAAMPLDTLDASRNIAFLSCGTWSLLGTELDAPVLSPESCRAELSNELGANGKVNYLKNIIGLWLIQESRREWKRQGISYTYADLEHLALEAEPFFCYIDPDAPEFVAPGDIPKRIRTYCARTNQKIPTSVGAIVRCIYESLALKYRKALMQLAELTGKRFERLHVLGGGAKDGLLCQMTANSLHIPVIAGPVEATALGNIIIQLTALKEIPDITAGRSMLMKAEPQTRYEPEEGNAWDDAYHKYLSIINKKE